MERITLLKDNRTGTTLRPMELDKVAAMLKNTDYQSITNEMRTIVTMSNMPRQDDGSLPFSEHYARLLPRLCFATLMMKGNHRPTQKSYTGMVMLEVDNLASYEEAVAVRQGAALMPQTLMAFVGLSGRSVKIVCRGELTGEHAGRATGERLPQTDDDIRRFHTNLYEKARMAYNAQLGVTIEKLEPRLDRICYVSYDPGAVLNPLAVPFYTVCSDVEQAVRPFRPTTIEPEEIVPGQNRYQSMHTIFEYNLMKAYDDTEGVTDNDDEHRHLLLTRLAGYCAQTGLPMAVARRLTMFSLTLSKDPALVELVFNNAYHESHAKKYRERKQLTKPLKNIPTETLLTMKIDIFLNSNYELRKNVMRGVAEFRERTGLGFAFRDLTEEARNSITMKALAQGIKCWDKDIRRYVNSDDIEPYDPVNDYLDHLPQWDGTDRVEPLARRVGCHYDEWPQLFHLWMRSMVAMWMGKGQLTGNALVPLLIGRQGCGKSSFCRILLPRELREYYNDRINFKNEADLNLGLTSFALINLDEFDKITQRQQIVLKYLVSTADLKYRPPYGKAYSSHRRYASFVGTTNDMLPLSDPSGSRRFICVEVEGNIDFESRVDYDQLYAQLKEEIGSGARYWLTKEEEQALMQRNRSYQRLNGLGEMLTTVVRRPVGDEEGQWLSLPDISSLLKEAFPRSYKEETGIFEKIGNFLSRNLKVENRHTNSGTVYRLVK